MMVHKVCLFFNLHYELDTWPRYVLNNFSIKKCLFGATNIVKNSDRYKYLYTGYGIAFD